MTAAVVVLPTPPVPQQMTTCRLSTSSFMRVVIPGSQVVPGSQFFDPAPERVGEQVELSCA